MSTMTPALIICSRRYAARRFYRRLKHQPRDALCRRLLRYLVACMHLACTYVISAVVEGIIAIWFKIRGEDPKTSKKKRKKSDNDLKINKKSEKSRPLRPKTPGAGACRNCGVGIG